MIILFLIDFFSLNVGGWVLLETFTISDAACNVLEAKTFAYLVQYDFVLRKVKI